MCYWVRVVAVKSSISFWKDTLDIYFIHKVLVKPQEIKLCKMELGAELFRFVKNLAWDYFPSTIKVEIKSVSDGSIPFLSWISEHIKRFNETVF